MEADGYKISYESIFMYPTMIYIPKSQKDNTNFKMEYYNELIEHLKIQRVVDFTTY